MRERNRRPPARYTGIAAWGRGGGGEGGWGVGGAPLVQYFSREFPLGIVLEIGFINPPKYISLGGGMVFLAELFGSFIVLLIANLAATALSSKHKL